MRGEHRELTAFENRERAHRIREKQSAARTERELREQGAVKIFCFGTLAPRPRPRRSANWPRRAVFEKGRYKSCSKKKTAQDFCLIFCGSCSPKPALFREHPTSHIAVLPTLAHPSPIFDTTNWGFCCTCARVSDSNQIQMRVSDSTAHQQGSICW